MASVLNSNLCTQYPEIIEQGQKRRWKWMVTNRFKSTPEFLLSTERLPSGGLVKIIHIHNKYSVVFSAYIFLVCLHDIVILQ